MAAPRLQQLIRRQGKSPFAHDETPPASGRCRGPGDAPRGCSRRHRTCSTLVPMTRSTYCARRTSADCPSRRGRAVRRAVGARVACLSDALRTKNRESRHIKRASSHREGEVCSLRIPNGPGSYCPLAFHKEIQRYIVSQTRQASRGSGRGRQAVGVKGRDQARRGRRRGEGGNRLACV